MDAQTRAASLVRLRAMGCSDPVLPAELNPFDLRHRREPSTVLKRAQCIAIVSNVANGFPHEEAAPTAIQLYLDTELLPFEREILAGQWDYAQRCVIGWSEQSALILSWSLGITAFPTDEDPDESAMLVDLYEADLSALSPISDQEVAEALDFTLCLHHLATRAVDVVPPVDFDALLWRTSALSWLAEPNLIWPPLGFDDGRVARVLSAGSPDTSSQS